MTRPSHHGARARHAHPAKRASAAPAVPRAPRFVDFVHDVLGVELSPAQRVLALVAFDGAEPAALEGHDRELARQLLGSVEVIPTEARDVLVAVCGARSGKSYVFGALYALWRALTAELSTLAPGEMATALIVGPDLKLSRHVVRYAVGAAESVPGIAQLIVAKSDLTLSLRRPDGHLVSVEALPAARGGSAVRGRSLVSAMLDESAFHYDAASGYVVNDQDTFDAVSPRILPGGLVVVASTPWAEIGMLYTMFVENHGHPVTAIAVKAPTLLMLDTERNRRVVAREEQRDPDNARREFRCVFGIGNKRFFPRDAIERCTDTGRLSAVPKHVEGRRFVIGYDASDKRDRCAIVAATSEWSDPDPVTQNREHRVTIVWSAETWKPNSSLDNIQRVKAFCRKFDAQHVYIDQFGGESLRELLRYHGVSSTIIQIRGGDAEESKLGRHRAVRDGFIAGHIRLPDLPELRNDLAQVASKLGSGGVEKIVAARTAGGHADLASALVLAVSVLLERSPSLPSSRMTHWERLEKAQADHRLACLVGVSMVSPR